MPGPGGFEFKPNVRQEQGAILYRVLGVWQVNFNKGVSMSFVALLVALAIAGFAVWVILQIPMPQIFKNIIIGVVTIFLVIWVLQLLGLDTGMPKLRLW